MQDALQQGVNMHVATAAALFNVKAGGGAKGQNSRTHHERFPGLERALKAPLRDMANSPCWSVVGQGCGFQVFSGGSRQMSVNVSRCTLPTHTPFVPFTVVRGRGILRSSFALSRIDHPLRAARIASKGLRASVRSTTCCGAG